MNFAVLTALVNGRFSDCWTITEADNKSKPWRFDTRAKAQAEIDDTMDDYKYEIEQGMREADEMPDSDEYLIVHVSEIDRHL